MGYQYTIVHRPGEELANADGLSHLPVSSITKDPPRPYDTILLMEQLNASLVTAPQIREWANCDPCLSKVRKLVMEGWTEEQMEGKLKPFITRKDELSVEDGCVLWGTQVVIPPQLQSRVIDELHEGHPGIGRMKSFTRSYVWWPSMDRDLEEKVKGCLVCQLAHKLPPKAPIHPWEWPEKPWTGLHIDHAGPVLGKTLLMIVDAYSK